MIYKTVWQQAAGKHDIRRNKFVHFGIASFPVRGWLPTSNIGLLMLFKGTIRRISPGRNRINFQILAYLLTIDLLSGTGCLSY